MKAGVCRSADGHVSLVHHPGPQVACQTSILLLFQLPSLRDCKCRQREESSSISRRVLLGNQVVGDLEDALKKDPFPGGLGQA